MSLFLKVVVISPSMAGLYCDMTLLASVGRETATNTMSRQAILYSSSGLMFSAQTRAQCQQRSRRQDSWDWHQFASVTTSTSRNQISIIRGAIWQIYNWG